MSFVRATKKSQKLRLALEGPAGTGKTFTALEIAKVLGGRVALIDSEHGSASLYSDRFDFDTDALEDAALATYMKAIEAARGYDVLIIDSLSHAWNGKGGALEQVDRMGGSKFTNGWKTVTPLQTQLIESILAFPGHVICTLRTKMEYVIAKDEHTGKIAPQKIGLAPVQRDGVDYEFGVVLDCAHGGTLTATKSRCPDVTPGSVFKWLEAPKLAATLRAWLADGVEATELDGLKAEIRGSISKEALLAMVPRITALPVADQAALRPLFGARIAEFQ